MPIVTGDKLTEIYLQNRKSLEFENRGGARARVEEVAIKSVQNVTKLDGGGFKAEIEWLVSGSVSHFGHTHYRRNLNNALVVFVQESNVWKIKDIEIIEETRLI